MINNLFSTKRFFIALTSTASIATALSLASCQDYDNGIDEEAIRTAQYNQSFKKEFGEIDPNHDWGFAMAEYFMGMSSTNSSSPATRADADPYHGTGANRVWKMDESRYINNVNYYPQDLFTPVPNIRDNEYEEVYAWFSTHKIDWGNTTPDVYCDGSNTAHITRPTTVTATPVFDDPQVVTELKNIYSNTSFAYASTATPRNCLGSLLTTGNNPIDDPIGSQNPEFINGWVQIVAGRNITLPKMNHIVFRNLSDSNPGTAATINNNSNDNWIHVLDFNIDKGYGYYRQDQYNAELVMGTNFSIVTYMNSFCNSYHDKYFIVYLEGNGYSGYYLGLDFESTSTNAFNEMPGQPKGPFPADGFCNDLIIKIGDAGQTPYNPCRVMCEDLGTNDFDFNDVVYDVYVNGSNVTITVQAVGGTIPVKLEYNGQVICEELHTAFGEATTTPINVLTARHDAKTYTLTTDKFDINKLDILVQYNNSAEWLKLADFDKMGGAPQKICIPNNTTKWTIENGRFKTAYPKFQDWVKNPLQYKFWVDSNINTSLLWN